MEAWLKSINVTLNHGKYSGDRTGTNVVRRFGDMLRFDLQKGFPLVTSKFTNFDSIKKELLWFLRGSSMVGSLVASGCRIWDEWVNPETAVVRDVSVKKLLKLSLAMEGFVLSVSYSGLISLFTTKLGKKPIFVSTLAQGFESSEVFEILVARPTGNEIQDTLVRMESLINVLLAANVDKNTIVSSGRLFTYFECKPWLQKIMLIQVPGQHWPVEIVDGDVGPLYPVQWRNVPVRLTFDNVNVLFKDWLKHDFSGNTKEELISEYSNHLDYMHKNCTNVGTDQIAAIIKNLKENPESRRMLVSAWNVSQLDQMQLPPCHFAFQVFSEELTANERLKIADNDEAFQLAYWHHKCDKAIDGSVADIVAFMDNYGIPTRGLRLMVILRSNDSALGQPFNIASYALLTHMLAQVTGHAPLEVIQVAGDIHIYENHIDAMHDLLNKPTFPLCKLVLNKDIKNIDDFTEKDIVVENYISGPYVPLEVAV